MYPDDLRYTKDHEWIRDEGGVYAVGITEYAAEQLGDITYVELPETGDTVKQGEVAGSIESVKAASDIYAPTGGRISEVNDELEGRPELINSSPYDDGWVFKLEDVRSSEFRGLMDAAAYEQYLGELEE